MKLILVGTTGFVGTEVLQQVLTLQDINSIIVLSRRALDSKFTTDSRVKVILMKDWTTYSPELLDELKGASACIWTMGVLPGGKLSSEELKSISIDYPVSAARAFATLSPAGEKFNFFYTSGKLAVKDQKASLFFLGEWRKIRGEAENRIIALAEELKDQLNVVVARPAFIIAKDAGITGALTSVVSPSVGVEPLSAEMIRFAIHGSSDKILLENSDLVKLGKAALASRRST